MAITNYLVHFKTKDTFESYEDQLRNDAVAFVGDATIIHTHGTDYYCGSGPVALIENLSDVAFSGSYNDLQDVPDAYTLPVATASELGGVKIGDGIDITVDGLISLAEHIHSTDDITDLTGYVQGSDTTVLSDGMSLNEALASLQNQISNASFGSGGSGTVTSITLTAGPGISINNSGEAITSSGERTIGLEYIFGVEGTYGRSSSESDGAINLGIPVITVDDYGRLTTTTETSVTFPIATADYAGLLSANYAYILSTVKENANSVTITPAFNEGVELAHGQVDGMDYVIYAPDIVDYLDGCNTVTTLTDLPVNKRLVIATVSSDSTMTLSSDLKDGRELHVIVKNTGDSTIKITNVDGSTFDIEASMKGGVNIVYADGTYYVESICFNNVVVTLTDSTDETVVHAFTTYSAAAAYAAENSGTNWHVTALSGDIPYQAFYYRTNLVSLTLNEGVTSIGVSAFYGCSGFTGSLTIPSSVTSIGDYAFRGCSGFTGSLTIPSSVTSIGDYAFYGCSGFTGSLTIPSSVTSIGTSAFYGCYGLENLCYWGTTDPGPSITISNVFTVCYVTEDYTDNTFCGLAVEEGWLIIEPSSMYAATSGQFTINSSSEWMVAGYDETIMTLEKLEGEAGITECSFTMSNLSLSTTVDFSNLTNQATLTIESRISVLP